MTKTTTVGIRLNDDERAAIGLKAQKAGLSMGRFLKSIAIQKPIKISKKADPLLIRQVAAIGNNLNQLTRKVHYSTLRKDDALRNANAKYLYAVLSDIEQDISDLIT